MVNLSFHLVLSECTETDSVSSCAIWNIKSFDITLKCFHIKKRKNSNNVNLVIVIGLNTISGKQA